MSSKIAEYIKQCFAEDITDHSAMCKKAKDRIVEIDKELAKADDLRIEKINLREILIGLGDDSVNKSKFNANSPKQLADDNSEESVLLRKKICEIIESSGSLTNREIISRLGCYEEDGKVIRAVKFLGIQEVIQRDDTNGNRIIPGPKWNEREDLIASKN